MSKKSDSSKRKGSAKQKGLKAIAENVKEASAKEVTEAMAAAAAAIDGLSQDKAALQKANIALYETVRSLQKIVVAERAQLIYYTQKALDFMHHKDVSVVLTNFADLPQDVQQEFVKKAVAEVGADSPIIPHEEMQVAQEKANPKKVKVN